MLCLSQKRMVVNKDWPHGPGPSVPMFIVVECDDHSAIQAPLFSKRHTFYLKRASPFGSSGYSSYADSNMGEVALPSSAPTSSGSTSFVQSSSSFYAAASSSSTSYSSSNFRDHCYKTVYFFCSLNLGFQMVKDWSTHWCLDDNFWHPQSYPSAVMGSPMLIDTLPQAIGGLQHTVLTSSRKYLSPFQCDQ